MDTPICDFVRNYAQKNNTRLHMPGHKGLGFLSAEKYDITEIDGADVLYASDGIIQKSQENAAALFETKRTLYSTEGSSLAIRAMVYLTAMYAKANGKTPSIAAGRNAHKTFITASAILNIDVSWIYGDNPDSMLCCNITPSHLDSFLENSAEKPTAVYITSPDYTGNIADLNALSGICRKHGVLFLVDNAHGSYLKFFPESLHPIDHGADMCCDSAHKTLPVLTGGAYLHISKNADPFFSRFADNAMAMFASTSPSYLILQSLDMANAYISGQYRKKLKIKSDIIKKLKSALSGYGFEITGSEPMKLTLAPKSFGYTGTEIYNILKSKDIVCEFADKDFVVMMFSPESGNETQLENVLLSLPKRTPISEVAPIIPATEKVLSLNEAIFSPGTEIPVCNASGKILASPAVSCPPAVSIVVCGERITPEAIECFKYYGIEKCYVTDKE